MLTSAQPLASLILEAMQQKTRFDTGRQKTRPDMTEKLLTGTQNIITSRNKITTTNMMKHLFIYWFIYTIFKEVYAFSWNSH